MGKQGAFVAEYVIVASFVYYRNFASSLLVIKFYIIWSVICYVFSVNFYMNSARPVGGDAFSIYLFYRSVVSTMCSFICYLILLIRYFLVH